MHSLSKLLFCLFLTAIIFLPGCNQPNNDQERVKKHEKRITVLESRLTKIDSVLAQQNKPKEGLVQVKCSLCGGAGRCDYCYGSKVYGGHPCSYCTPAYSRTPTGLCKTCKGTVYILKKTKV